MSTVRMSDQLQRDITRKAEDMYDKAHPIKSSQSIWVIKYTKNILKMT